MVKAHHTSAMHFELKAQYAWEVVMLEYGKHYADKCFFDGDGRYSRIMRHSRENPDMTPSELAKYAIGEFAAS